MEEGYYELKFAPDRSLKGWAKIILKDRYGSSKKVRKIKKFGVWGCTKILKKRGGKVLVSYRTPWLYDPYFGGCYSDHCGFKSECIKKLKSIKKIKRR